MDLAQKRAEAVADTVARIREIEQAAPLTRDAMEAMKDALVALARQTELFPRDEYPTTGDETEDTHVLSVDPDGRYALYLFSSGSESETPPHDHTTWAVIAGVEGAEHNRIYRRLDDGATPGEGRIELDREFTVNAGTGLALMPEDVHSIHCEDGEALLHLHMYGKAFEHQDGQVSFDMAAGTTAPYGFSVADGE